MNMLQRLNRSRTNFLHKGLIPALEQGELPADKMVYPILISIGEAYWASTMFTTIFNIACYD